MATKTKPKMTEQQFIAKYKKAGFELFHSKEIKERIEAFDAELKSIKEKRLSESQKQSGLSKTAFTKQMFKEIKEIAAAGFHYQAFVLLGVFIAHVRDSYYNGMVIEHDFAIALLEAKETYRPGKSIRFSDSNHMQKTKSGARVLSIHETLKEIESEMERKGILKDDFLSFE